jgi:hypothetical protein
MKIGIIIVFELINKSIGINEFVDYFNKSEKVKFCLVNNNNNNRNDVFIENLLNKVANRCDNVTVVNVKKSSVAHAAAIRYGARYLNSHFNLKHLGYIENSEHLDIISCLGFFNVYKENIKQDLITKKSQAVKKSFLKNIFSVASYIIKFNKDFGNLAKS